MLALLTLLAAADVTVTFDVKQGGDVKWRATPCSVDVQAVGDEATLKAGIEPAGGVVLPAGKYDAIVTCDSDEGPIKKSAWFVVKGDDMSVPVSIDPGFLLVNVLRFDTPVRAEITVFDERGRELARSRDKAVISLAQGKVRLLAKVDPSSFVGGGLRPVFATAAATVIARQKTTIAMDTTDGELLVTLSDNGRKVGGIAALRAPGQKTRLVELRAGEKASVPPGVYDLVTQLEDTHDFSEVLTKDIVIGPKKTTTRAVAHRTGTVKPTILVHGKAPPAEAKIDVELSLPGAAQTFNTIAVGDVIKMAPGPVEITARRTDAVLDDGASPSATAKVIVASGAQKQVTIDLSWATLEVTSQVGGKARALELEVLPQGGDTPVAKKTAGADGKASFSLSAGRFLLKAILKAPQGDIVTQQPVSLALGSRLGAKLNLDVGTAVVQVFEGGVAVPAEVRFFKKVPSAGDRSLDGRPVGDPMLAVPAGQEAILPPGTYALFVKRKGDEKGYSDIKVAAGRTVERTVEITPPAPTSTPAPALPPPTPRAPAPTKMPTSTTVPGSADAAAPLVAPAPPK